MRLRNTIIVLVLLVIVGGYALIVLTGSRPVPPATLLKVKARDINHIDLRYPDRDVELVRNPDHTWRIVKPIKADADQSALDSLTRTLAQAQLTKTIEAKPASLAPFGLDKPAVVVTITADKGGPLPVLDVGKMSPIGNGAYVKLAGAPAVLMTTSDFPAAVSKPVNDLRSHELMTFNMDQANKIAIQSGPGGRIEVDKQGGKWQIVQPAHYLADSDAVSQFLTTLANARVADFVSDAPKDLGKYGLEKPKLELSIFTGKDDARHALLLGLEEPQGSKVYAKRASDPFVFAVDDTLIGKVNLNVSDLRDKTVMAFDPAKAGRLEIDNRGKLYALELASNGKWQVVAGGKASPASGSAVQTFLDELSNLKGSKIVADPMTEANKYGLNKPTEKITVFDKGGKRIGTVELAQLQSKVEVSKSAPGSAEGKQQASAPAEHETKSVTRFENYAYSTAGTPVYSLPEADFSQFDMTADQFKPTEPVQPAATPTPAKKA
jgi:Domain of unknown function (DUF4340)